MFDKFDEIFWEVGEAHGLTTWWEIFDSEVFYEVEEKIFETCGENPDGYQEWVEEMAEEL